MATLKPLGDRVVIKPMPREEMTKSGIYLPDTAKEKPQEGTVVAVGTGRQTDDGKTVAMTVKVADRVLYAKYAGTEFKQEDEELLIVSEKDTYWEASDVISDLLDWLCRVDTRPGLFLPLRRIVSNGKATCI